MNAADYSSLEARLLAAEELFVGTIVNGAKAIEIRTELRGLLTKVIAERIRAEERERSKARGAFNGAWDRKPISPA